MTSRDTPLGDNWKWLVALEDDVEAARWITWSGPEAADARHLVQTIVNVHL